MLQNANQVCAMFDSISKQLDKFARALKNAEPTDA